MPLVALLAALAAQASAPATPPAPAPQPVTEDSCSLVAAVDGKSQVIGPLSEFHVLNGPYHLPVSLAPGATLQAVVCLRSSVVPDVRDDRVPRLLGVPLYLNKADPRATAKISSDAGVIDVKLLYGQWTDPEKRLVDARLTLFNSRPAAQ